METNSTSTNTSSRLVVGALTALVFTVFAVLGCASLGAVVGVVTDTAINPDDDWTGIAGMFFGALVGVALGSLGAIFTAVKVGTTLEIAVSVASVAAIPVLYILLPIIF